MRIRYRILSVILIFACTGALFMRSGRGSMASEEITVARDEENRTVRLWYSDPALTDYLTVKAVEYNNGSQGVRVEPVLKESLSLLDEVARTSVNDEIYPDLYVISNDMLEKAYLAGLATEIDDPSFITDLDSDFGSAARNSVCFRGEYIGYPFYFETSSLLYNRTYLEEEAARELEEERDRAEGEDAQEDVDNMLSEGEMPGNDEELVHTGEPLSQQDIDARMKELLPGSISDIQIFADRYNAPEQVEAVFKWDVTDIFYNYFFVGNYMNVGGDAGDDPDQIDIYNEFTLDCMCVYQQLRSFFAIDAGDISYESVIQDFIDGRIVFTVATTDCVSRIEQAKAKGECSFDYGVAVMPGVTPGYHSRTMSVTETLVINGYSPYAKEANSFARFLLNDCTDTMYRMTGKMAAHAGIDYDNDSLTSFIHVYEDSVPVTKLLEISNFWVQLEIAFSKIWDGEDVNETMRALSELTMRQVTGSQYHEEPLPDPEIIFTYSLEGADED